MAIAEQQTHASLPEFLKATIAGGLLFLLPLILVILLLTHAMRIAAKVAHPIAKALTLDAVLGPAAEELLAATILIAISIAAGLIARTITGRSIMRWSENSFFGGLPQYRLVKTMAEGLAQVEKSEDLKPVLVSIEEGWQIGYLLEQLHDGWVAVFLPQAPTPMSGNVMYLPTERVRPLAITMVEAMSIIKRMGIGSSKALHSADLALPKSA